MDEPWSSICVLLGFVLGAVPVWIWIVVKGKRTKEME